MLEPFEGQLLIFKTDPLESENCKPFSVTQTIAKTNVEIFFQDLKVMKNLRT